MGKGGIDHSVRAKLCRLMDAHPYKPGQATGDDAVKPYLLADAVRELYSNHEGLSNEELFLILLYTSAVSRFEGLRKVLAETSALSASKVVAAATRDIMYAYAMEDEELVAENKRREQTYRLRQLGWLFAPMAKAA